MHSLQLFLVLIPLLSFSTSDIIVNLNPNEIIDEQPIETPGTLIVGGAEAARNEFPTIVNLIISIRNNSNGAISNGLCGGNIISPNYILTAAHCLHHPGATVTGIKVTAGDHLRNTVETTEQILQGSRTIVHGSYDPIYLNNDIGLVELERNFSINNNVQVASVSDPTYPAYERTIATVAGWGRNANNGQSTNELRKANMSIITNSDCSTRYSSVQNARIVSSMVCALQSGRGTCNGDSGGPIYCHSATEGQFVCGLTSFGVAGNCGDSYYPSVFTRISSHVNWIKTYVPSLRTSGYYVQTTTQRNNSNKNFASFYQFLLCVIAIIFLN